MQVLGRMMVSRGDIGGPNRNLPPRVPEPEFEFSQQRQQPGGGRVSGEFGGRVSGESLRGGHVAATAHAPPAGQQLKKNESSSSTGGSGGEVCTCCPLSILWTRHQSSPDPHRPTASPPP